MRLFAAILLDHEMRRALTGVQQALRAAGARANYTRAENLHLTLAFLGETDDLALARHALAYCTGAPFALTLTHVGRFGNLWWVGADGGEALERLALCTQDAFRRAGFPIERRAFRAHITLARGLSLTAPPRLEIPSVRMAVREVSLMRSDCAPGGGVTYTQLGSVKLHSGKGSGTGA